MSRRSEIICQYIFSFFTFVLNNSYLVCKIISFLDVRLMKCMAKGSYPQTSILFIETSLSHSGGHGEYFVWQYLLIYLLILCIEQTV